MYEARFTERQVLGMHRLTGDNSGEVFTNERTETVTDPESGEERTEYVYDIYQITDVRNRRKAKNDVIEDAHPYGDETKILRKTLAALLKQSGKYDSEEFAAFKAYNEFAESVRVK